MKMKISLCAQSYSFQTKLPNKVTFAAEKIFFQNSAKLKILILNSKIQSWKFIVLNSAREPRSAFENQSFSHSEPSHVPLELLYLNCTSKGKIVL